MEAGSELRWQQNTGNSGVFPTKEARDVEFIGSEQ